MAALSATGHWRASPGGPGIAYANPDTGARASLEPLETPSLPPAFRPVGLGFVLNYVRPSWFALETIPAFADAVAAAGLFVLDPQAHDAAPIAPESGRLVASWARGNEAAIGAARSAGADVPSLEPDRSLAWWHHQRAPPRSSSRSRRSTTCRPSDC